MRVASCMPKKMHMRAKKNAQRVRLLLSRAYNTGMDNANTGSLPVLSKRARLYAKAILCYESLAYLVEHHEEAPSMLSSWLEFEALGHYGDFMDTDWTPMRAEFIGLINALVGASDLAIDEVSYAICSK